MITLDQITSENLHTVLALDVTDSQKAYYPHTNAHSIAEGFFPPDEDPVWMKAICNDGTPIGFMMTSEIPNRGEYFLWRMMIDSNSQGHGFGAQAMRLLIKRVIDQGNPQVLLLSHMKHNTAAGRFYLNLGFKYTEDDPGEDEISMRLTFNS